MFRSSIPVLLVDDDPDVLAVSKLAMKNFNYEGVPLRILTASSAAEAKELVAKERINVAFIDVVMETETAGLDLCRHIRETINDRFMQLFIRTGQPGVAQEREVIDRYDINGYFTKAEATEEKLYSLVKSGVRQSQTIAIGLAQNETLQRLIEHGDSRSGLAEALVQLLEKRPRDAGFGLLVDGQVFARNLSAEQAGELREQLSSRPGSPLGGSGDRVVQEGNDLLILVPGGPKTTEAALVFRTFAPVNHLTTVMLHQMLRAVATLWNRAS